ncbi:MAG: N-6 DNA methylase, partial [Chloroflexi bacterium]|nr:N-6 DNA methylase [Chloroflexota bacterium]
MTSIPQTVLDLVERYHHNRDRYRRPDYNETQVRREFIDPFFGALGWDVANTRGVAPQYREVVHEATLRDRAARSGMVAPDYAFRVGPERKFFVEAKKPAVDIRTDPSPAYQLRRYAWTAKLPLSVLTDFEELSVYDCRFKPAQGDSAAKARVVALSYEQYPERWAEIVGLLGREAVWRGDFDRYVESTRAKRGTQAVDDAFLAEIEGWRVALARNIALRNPSLSVRDMNYAVGKLIDRLIFLRICEDRDIEPYGQLREAIDGSDAYNRLLALFRRADDRYNSGLFHFGNERGRSEPADTLTPDLILDDRVLKEIISGLYYPASPYEFSVLGTDILGNVYERFLGSVIRLTPAHRAVVDQKPEVRKAGGVYYTPQYIVDYIVEHTVGPLLETKSPGQVANLRILDPACGSGSFLLGAYQYLLDWHLRWYTEHPTATPRREVYPGPDGEPRLTTAEKRRILLNNIHGVDIDSQAVEVTKLSLLLKVLEDETSTSLQLALMPERALPDLGRNIQCGNSLIGPDFYDGQQMALLGEDEWERVNPFDWAQGFPEAMAAGGFDAVIGNPPYIRMETFKELKQYLKQNYATHDERADLYTYIIERSHTLLSSRGMFGMIVSNKFLRANYGTRLRRYLMDNTSVTHILDLAGLPVFRGATVRTIVLITTRTSDSTQLLYCPPLPVEEFSAVEDGRRTLAEAARAHQYNIPAAVLDRPVWSFRSAENDALLQKITRAFPPLSERIGG